ncbi:MAG: serine/threonine protein kinase [Sclerophora amabilis]|nr:MAG: serine/threonine protein kinase [Sclerophora amabilis]
MPGTNVNTGQDVAIKLEHIVDGPSFLYTEVEIFRSLSGGAGIPHVHWYGTECEYNAMVFDLLGPSLEDLFNFCSRKFSLKTVLMLADQLICRLQHVHSRRFVYRDVKPENFLMGVGRCGNQVYLIDLGLTRDLSATQRTVPQDLNQEPTLVGTAAYASINGHLGIR